MAFEKFASAEVIGCYHSPKQVGNARLASITSLANLLDSSEKYDESLTSDGYLYLDVRAISSRINANYDAWGSEDLQKHFATFEGKPFYVEHHNSDPRRARGVIVDAALHVDDDIEKVSSLDPFYATCDDIYKPASWVETLVEIDAKTYPKLAKAIIDKKLKSVSMGALVSYTLCTVCGNRAEDPRQFCSHVQQKGREFAYVNPNTGKTEMRLAAEICKDFGFFELSGVNVPADETANSLGLKHASEETKIECPNCKGSGGFKDGYCAQCEGEGKVDANDPYAKSRAQGLVPEHKASVKTAGMSPEEYIKALIELVEKGAVEVTDPTGRILNPEEISVRVFDEPDLLIRRKMPGKIDPEQDMVAGDTVPFRSQDEENYYRHASNDLVEAARTEFKQAISEGAPNETALKAVLSMLKNSNIERDNAVGIVRAALGDQPFLSANLASVKEADNARPFDKPREQLQTAPDFINTQEQEQSCPICGAPEMRDGHCGDCGYVTPPEGYGAPNLDKAQQVEEELKQSEEQGAQDEQLNELSGPGAEPGNAAEEDPNQPQQMAASIHEANQYIEHRDGSWVILQKGTGKVLSHHDSKEKAEAAFRAMEMNKHGNHFTVTYAHPDITIGSSTTATSSYTSLKIASTERDLQGGRVKTNEKPLLPAAFARSDKPKEPQVVKDYQTPVLSGYKLAEETVDVEQVQSGPSVESLDPKTVSVSEQGGVGLNPEPAHESVETENNQTGPHAQTYPDKGQHTPVSGPVMSSAHTACDCSECNGKNCDDCSECASKKEAAFPDHEPTKVDLDGPLKEEVGDEAKTWSGTKDQADPVTHETISKVRSEAYAHAVASFKLAETEVALGITDARSKFARIAQLEDSSMESIKASLEALVKARKASVVTPARKVANAVPNVSQMRATVEAPSQVDSWWI